MWPFKKKENSSPNGGHTLDEVDRANSIESRKINLELKKAERDLKLLEIEREKALVQADIDDLVGDDGDDPMMSAVLGMLAPKLSPQLQNLIPGVQKSDASITSPNEEQSPTPGINMTDEQLIKIYNRLPPHIKKQAKKLPDDEVRSLIQGSLGALNEDSLNRAVAIVKNS